MKDLTAFCKNIQQAENGIWYAPAHQPISYPDQGNECCFEVEASSFWFKHRNQCILSLVEKYSSPLGVPFFDIGGGNGYVSAALANKGYEIILVEPGENGVQNAQKRGLENLICSTFDAAGIKNEVMGSVGLFDVIEHIEDDLSMLKALHPLISKNGKCYISVPAFSFLWSEKDVFSGHFRRYTLKTLSNLLTEAGFKLRFGTYIFRFLPVPIFLLRSIPSKISKKLKKSIGGPTTSRTHVVQKKWKERLLQSFFSGEVTNIREGRAMRFGASCLVVADKV